MPYFWPRVSPPSLIGRSFRARKICSLMRTRSEISSLIDSLCITSLTIPSNSACNRVCGERFSIPQRFRSLILKVSMALAQRATFPFDMIRCGSLLFPRCIS